MVHESPQRTRRRGPAARDHYRARQVPEAKEPPHGRSGRNPRGVSRLKDTLGFGGTDDIGAGAALDVQGTELSSLAAGQMVHWSPWPARALLFDRTTDKAPQVIIPFQRPDPVETAP